MTAAVDPSCRSCGAPSVVRILSLGRTPLANALVEPEGAGQPEPEYPLDLAFCRQCTLLQLEESVPPESLFSTYVYFSSFSDSMVRHAAEIAARLIHDRRLGAGALVIEVASNDGYLLQHYQRAGIPVLGIEPAANIAEVASGRGVPTRCEFFGRSLAEGLAAAGTRADVLHANNVLAHVPDLNGVVAGFRLVLAPHGVAVVEVPYARDMLERCEFDTIYHEHLCYFTLTALDRLFSRNELLVYDVERLEIHGGSLRLFAGHPSAVSRSERVQEVLREERTWVGKVEYYEGFARRVGALRSSLRELLGQLKASGKRIAAYGAAAKGSTLLNYCGIDAGTIDFVVDRSPHKQGRYMPGVRIPIADPSELLASMPDYVLLLTWNFADEILQQQAEYRSRGGRFIVPVPAVRIV
jgi:SAM-dependent methyltransferase